MKIVWIDPPIAVAAGFNLRMLRPRNTKNILPRRHGDAEME